MATVRYGLSEICTHIKQLQRCLYIKSENDHMCIRTGPDFCDKTLTNTIYTKQTHTVHTPQQPAA